MYLDFYGLKEMPFSITPDPRFLYYSEHHREAYHHLLYGIEMRKGFIQLTGEVGSGKTTLCRAILSALRSKNVETALILNPSLSEGQLIRSIVKDFGLKSGHRDRLYHIEQLNKFLLEKSQAGYNVALMIDEAQDLSPEVMEQVRLLSNLETDQHKLMQIVLCGQPELEDRLSRPDLRQLRQRISIRYHLTPLSETETAAYIAYRLNVAGSNGGTEFDAGAVRMVHRYAAGIPRLINAVCDNSLLAAYVAKARTVTSACVKRAIQLLEGRG